MLVTDPTLWPPGSLMGFDNTRNYKTEVARVIRRTSLPWADRGLGLVVANDGTLITVVWDAGSKLQLAVYTVASLNSSVVYPVDDLDT